MEFQFGKLVWEDTYAFILGNKYIQVIASTKISTQFFRASPVQIKQCVLYQKLCRSIILPLVDNFYLTWCDRLEKDTEVSVCNTCAMVDDKTFNGSDHFAECTIFHSRHADQYEVHRTTAPKETVSDICKICECMFCKVSYLKLHFAEKHDLYNPNFQLINLPPPFIDMETLFFKK